MQLLDALEWCLDLGISCVSVYAFSIDNFKRPPQEVAMLMQLAEEKLEELMQVRHLSHATENSHFGNAGFLFMFALVHLGEGNEGKVCSLHVRSGAPSAGVVEWLQRYCSIGPDPQHGIFVCLLSHECHLHGHVWHPSNVQVMCSLPIRVHVAGTKLDPERVYAYAGVQPDREARRLHQGAGGLGAAAGQREGGCRAGHGGHPAPHPRPPQHLPVLRVTHPFPAGCSATVL